MLCHKPGQSPIQNNRSHKTFQTLRTRDQTQHVHTVYTYYANTYMHNYCIEELNAHCCGNKCAGTRVYAYMYVHVCVGACVTSEM